MISFPDMTNPWADLERLIAQAVQPVARTLNRHVRISSGSLTGLENEAQMDVVYREEGLKVIRAHPVQYVLLSAYRFLPLWFNWGYFSSYDLPMKAEDKGIMVFQGFLLVLALAGLYGNVARAWPLWGSILVVSLTYMAVDSQLLYLMPVMPLVMSLSAVGGISLMEKFLWLRRQRPHHS